MSKNAGNIFWPDGTSTTVKVEEQRESIANLKPGILQQKLVGVIISKQDLRSFADKKNCSQQRWQFRFTLRDSPDDYINVSCWGGETFVNNISKSFKIGDSVEVSNVLVQRKQSTAIDDKYNPWTPSGLNIIANEPYAKIRCCYGDGITSFAGIAFLPVKDSNDYYKLDEVISNSHNLTSLHVNLLAAIRDVGLSKEIVTKTGKAVRRRELQIFDETCSCFILTMWGDELNEFADTWVRCETVLFLADVRINLDEYRNRLVAVCDGKTIITVNPDIPDAHLLYGYMQSANLVNDEQFMAEQPHDGISQNIQELFTVERLQKWIDEMQNQLIIYGIVDGYITNFNIDSSSDGEKVYIQRCSSCKYPLDLQDESCSNTSCSFKYQNEASVLKQLDMRIDISDVSGGMSNFRLKGSSAEMIIGCTVNDVLKMDLKARTELKWTFLMERFKIHFKCSRQRDNNSKAFLEVLSIQPVETK